MAMFWERLRSSAPLKGSFLFLAVALIAVGAALLPTPRESPFADAERFAFDLQMRALRAIHPRAHRRWPMPSASPSTCRCACCARCIRARWKTT